MTREEVNAVTSLADVNADGKFDYIKVRKFMLMQICVLCRGIFKRHIFLILAMMYLICCVQSVLDI